MSTCVFYYRKQLNGVVSASLIGQSTSSFFTVLHMFERVFLTIKNVGVFTKLVCVKKKVESRCLRVSLIFITI